MKIRCILNDSQEYNQFCGFENSVYTLRISKNYDYWYFDLCDLIDFYNYKGIECELSALASDIALARRLYGNHHFNEYCLRDYEGDVLVHSTTKNNVASILSDRAIKSWNILKSEKQNWEEKPIGALLGDIDDFSNYVMLSTFHQNNEVVTASKYNQTIDINVNQIYCAGARFYIDARALAADGLLIRDGQHLKVKDYIDLDKYLLWYCTPEKLQLEEMTTPKDFFELSNQFFIGEYK